MRMFGGREQNYVRAVTSVEQQVRVLREHDSLIDTRLFLFGL